MDAGWPVLLATPALDLASKLCTNGERGLAGLAVHPNFAAYRFIYLYYTCNRGTLTCPEDEVNGLTRLAARLTASLEVLAQVARGRTNHMAGEALGVSERTVRNHLRSISKKLSTSDRTHAVVLAIEGGWTAIPIVPEDEAEPGSGGEAPTESSTRGAAR